MDLFRDLIPSILQTKQDVLEDEKDYNAYIVNRALSGHLDCILYANEMNKNHFLPKRIQYDYLRHSIRAMKRKFAPWYKPARNDKINTIMDYFGYSQKKAEQAEELISEEALMLMKETIRIGGTK